MRRGIINNLNLFAFLLSFSLCEVINAQGTEQAVTECCNIVHYDVSKADQRTAYEAARKRVAISPSVCKCKSFNNVIYQSPQTPAAKPAAAPAAPATPAAPKAPAGQKGQKAK